MLYSSFQTNPYVILYGGAAGGSANLLNTVTTEQGGQLKTVYRPSTAYTVPALRIADGGVPIGCAASVDHLRHPVGAVVAERALAIRQEGCRWQCPRFRVVDVNSDGVTEIMKGKFDTYTDGSYNYVLFHSPDRNTEFRRIRLQRR
ncbi:hypothetical protein [Sinorhizobium saheli]|uniref:hypothetical protein n=1 Tax=Sinorhizobium saheli TaxID=36856 RepID=UPI0012978462|nr:hypothetical protein [Sinorhizobium saheli]MQW89621.1 hypothetical protein [Sinorhizobium saheli]